MLNNTPNRYGCAEFRRLLAMERRSFLKMGVLGLAGPGRCDEFPYTACVNSADVFVRSGPGKNYYPTDKLSKGDKVEVYRHDPGGWCAAMAKCCSAIRGIPRSSRRSVLGWSWRFDPRASACWRQSSVK